jgi:hypothetical protein
MKRFGVAAGSNEANADLILGHEMIHSFASDAYKATPDCRA